ncbi:hypothetical protein BH23PSE1_BH23PSE1_11990 [soil metagenome]
MVRQYAADAAPRRALVRRRAGQDAPLPLLATTAGSLLLFAYLLSIFLPGSFSIGPIRLTLFRLILILVFVPLALRWIQGQAGRITAPDIFFLLFCLWVSLATFAVHGTSQIPYIGATFLEYFGAYLFGRVCIRSAADHVRLFKYFLCILVAMLPFALVEALTRVRLLPHLFSMVFAATGEYESDGRPRLGITRVAVGFNHPILWGVVCSLGIANLYYIFKGRARAQLLAVGFVGFMTFLSVSNAPLFSMVMQALMIAWDRILNIIRLRWVLLAGLSALGLGLLQLLLPGGLIGYIVDELLFNPAGGMTRIAAFTYGSAEVMRNPLFGIGLGDWIRPYWQHGSVDNLWLVIAMRHGLPALVFLILAMAVSAFFMMARSDLDEEESRFRAGYLIALCGLVLALCTVHIWAGALVFVMTYLGAGSWLYERGEAGGTPRRASRERMSLRPERTDGRTGERDGGRDGGRGPAPDPGAHSGRRRAGEATAGTAAGTAAGAAEPGPGPAGIRGRGRPRGSPARRRMPHAGRLS